MILRFGEFQLSQDIGCTCVHLSRQESNHDLVSIKIRKQRKTTLLSQFSKDDKTYDLPSNDPEPGQEIQTDIVNKIIRDAVDQLSEKFKIVIVLRDIQGLSYEDISEIINVPIGTVKSRINRARLQLQVELKHLKK